MSRLNNDLADIHNIMRQNIQEVLNRGERVERTLSIHDRTVSLSVSLHRCIQNFVQFGRSIERFEMGSKEAENAGV